MLTFRSLWQVFPVRAHPCADALGAHVARRACRRHGALANHLLRNSASLSQVCVQVSSDTLSYSLISLFFRQLSIDNAIFMLFADICTALSLH